MLYSGFGGKPLSYQLTVEYGDTLTITFKNHTFSKKFDYPVL